MGNITLTTSQGSDTHPGGARRCPASHPPSVGAARWGLAESGSVGHRTPKPQGPWKSSGASPPRPAPSLDCRGNRGPGGGGAGLRAPRRSQRRDWCPSPWAPTAVRFPPPPPPPPPENLSREGTLAPSPSLWFLSPPSAVHPPAARWIGSGCGSLPSVHAFFLQTHHSVGLFLAVLQFCVKSNQITKQASEGGDSQRRLWRALALTCPCSWSDSGE